MRYIQLLVSKWHNIISIYVLEPFLAGPGCGRPCKRISSYLVWLSCEIWLLCNTVGVRRRHKIFFGLWGPISMTGAWLTLLETRPFPNEHFEFGRSMEGRRTQDQCPPSVVSPYASRHQVASLRLQRWSSTPNKPTSTHGNYPGTASNPIRAYRPNGRQCRRKEDLDFLAFCVLEETTMTIADDLDEDGAERPRLPRAVMDRHSRPGPEPTTLEAVVNQWRYALV